MLTDYWAPIDRRYGLVGAGVAPRERTRLW